MKRGAEKQLSKDDAEDVEQEDMSTAEQRFRKADEAALASRQIRALPKRSSAISLGSIPDTPSAPTPEVSPLRKFGSFSGFGTTSVSSSSFTFSPDPNPNPNPPTSTPVFGTPPTSTGSIFGAKPSAPSVSSSASGATKTFASLLSNPPPNTAPSDKKDEIDPAALKYYSSLRGLNVSFLSAISKAVEQDPFTDISDLVTHYKNFRISVQKDFDEKPKAAPKPPAEPTPTSFFAASVSSSGSSTAKPPATMPAPPSTFAGFGKVTTPSTAESLPAGSGFTPKAEGAAPSIFPLPTPSTTPTTSSSPAKSAFGSTVNVPDFFSSSSSSFKPSTDSPPKPTSAFGASPSIFGAKATPPIATDKPAAFSSYFGSTSKTLETDKEKEPKSEPSVSTSLFGGATSNPFNVSDKSPTTNLFGGSSSVFGSSTSGAGAGATTAKPASVFGGFGSSKTGTFGNPVGFGFGSAPKTPDGETAKPTPLFGSKPIGFGGSTFGGFGSSEKPAGGSGSQGEEEDVGSSAIAATDTADDSKSVPTKSHDEEGEGEEDEDTAHTTKCKVFKLQKKDDGAQEWRDWGVGMLRLKKHKTSESRRVLMRNSSTGKITINFNIYAGLNPLLATKFITLIGHDEEGISATYRLRTQSDQHAKDLKDALDREIAFVKGTTD